MPPSDNDNEVYSNVRQILGHLIGKTIVDITQHDKEEFEQTGQSYIMFMFDSGDYFKAIIGDDGFYHSAPGDDEESIDPPKAA